MSWLSSNWIWVLFGVGFLALHAFGHGRHGRHRSAEVQSQRVPAEHAGSAGAEGKLTSGHDRHRGC
jgi:hypothetical protein